MKHNRLSLVLALALAAALSSAAFAQGAAPAPAAESEELDELDAPLRDPSAANPAPAHPELRPVLEQFGGKAGLDALMEDFMARMLVHPRLKPFFENSDQATIKQHLSTQFCVILGGDCVYEGRDMKSSHEMLGITRADFNALVEVLQVSMNQRDIPFSAQNKLLAKLAPMHREIITE